VIKVPPSLLKCKTARAWAVLLLLALLPTQSPMATKYAGEFMALGGGARALGMGSAFVSIANDASTVFWNPAGISGFKKRQALFMHSERFGQEINYNFASYVMPFNSFSSPKREGALGFALIHVGIDGFIITNMLKYDENNNVPGFQPEEGDRLRYDLGSLPRESNNDFALFSSFAMKTAYGRVGGSLKLLYTNAVAGYSSFGLGLDLGFLKENILPNLNFGAKLQDATGTYISWSSGTNEFIYPVLKMGTSYTFAPSYLNGSLIVALDSDLFFDNRRYVSQLWIGRMSADIHLGGELRFQDKVMVRGGLDAGNPTAGAGIRFWALGFDYAYLHHDAFEATHRVSAFANF